MKLNKHGFRRSPGLAILKVVGLMTSTLRNPDRKVEKDISPMPVLNRLLPPLTAILFLLLAGSGLLLWHQHQLHLNERMAALNVSIATELQVDLQNQASGLATALQPIVSDPRVLKALRESDFSKLLYDWKPLYETLRREHNLTHFYFFDRKRDCVLRVYNPEKRGGQNNRFTALESERTKKTTSGLEIGSRGTFTLRAITPVFEGDILLGYVELGKEIEEVLTHLHKRFGGHIAVAIRKKHLKREQWEEGMRLLNREAHWNKLPNSVIIYSSQNPLPKVFSLMADHDRQDGHNHNETDREISYDGKIWRVSATAIHDASGKDVGDLLVMSDITASKNSFLIMMAISGMSGFIVLTFLLGFVSLLLSRTDAGIRVQQAELRESEEKFRLIAETSVENIWQLDLNGNVTYTSPASEKVFGFKARDAIQKNFAAFFPEYELEKASETFKKALSGVKYQLLEIKALKKGGVHAPIEISIVPILRDGTIVGVQGIARDISERKQAENELKRSREQFELAVQGSNDGIWDWDLRDNSLFLSSKWKEQLGYRDDEIPNCFHSFKSNLHPEDRDRVMTSIKEYLSGQELQYENEFRLKHKDGFWCWILARGAAVRGSDGKPIRMAGSHTDITERKMAERQMAALSAVVEHSDNIIVVKDLDLKVIAANNTFAKVTGRASVSELIGKTDAEIFHVAPDVEPIKSYMQDDRDAQKLPYGEFIYREEPVVTAEGIVRTVLTKKYPIFNKSNILFATGNISIDITDLKKAEADLLETNQQLEEAIARANEMAMKAEMASIAKSEFLANMSHEIRTPMNGVIGMTGLLLDTDLNDEQRRYAQTISTSGEALLTLINDILDFSKIEAGKLDLEILNFDLSTLLEDFAATLAVRAHEKGLELLCSADPRVPVLLQGDPGRLRQILTNLTGNAIKFTSSGEVEIGVRLDEVVPQTDEHTVVLRFSIRDTGIGIPRDKTAMLFDKFTQADASTTRQYGGTGLGLAISKQLVELMGGRIGVISEEGKGSEFWFTARFDNQPEENRTETINPADLNHVRILIVDDNETNRKILVTRLSSWGMRPVEVENGPLALQALYLAINERDPFRLAVIDMQMPGMDGRSLGRGIKADPALAEIHMVMLTSMGTRGDARQFEEIGFSGYLTKPVRHKELRDILSVILAGSDEKERPPRPIATRHTAREAITGFHGCSARILLAEDNITNQQVALGLLKKLGLKADAVTDGQEVLKSLESIPYDLVLMDCQMPVLDGFEATRTIRNHASNFRNIPIIALTAHAMQGDRMKCLASGMNDHVSKPVSARNLVDILEKWLPDLRQNKEKTENKSEDPLSTVDNASPMIWNRSAMLERLNNDEDLAEKIITGFLSDIPRQIQILGAKIENNDMTAAERQAHTIRGAAAVVGGEALLALAFKIEQSAAAGVLNDVRESVDWLRIEFEQLKKTMGR